MKFRANRVKARFCNSMPPKLQNLKGTQIMKKTKFFFFFLSALLVSGNVWGYALTEGLCFTSTGNTTVQLNRKYYVASSAKEYVSNPTSKANYVLFRYCIDDGDPVDYTLGDLIYLTNGQKLYFASRYGKNIQMSTGENQYYYNFTMGGEGTITISGKIASLFTSYSLNDKFPVSSKSDYSYYFCKLFKDCLNLTSAKNLVLPQDVTNWCYAYMFYGCNRLTEAPTLPATTLAESCYKGMFWGCALTKAPELKAMAMKNSCYYRMFYRCANLIAPKLPATTLADCCYYEMFKDCNYMSTIPPELPATDLIHACYYGMFANCYNISNVPELPATNLANACYSNMFSGCISLTTAPELPATTLTERCYYYMFEGCSKLCSIKCLATDISATSCTENWVSGVKGTGTITINSQATCWGTAPSYTRDASHIPTGWTVQTFVVPSPPTSVDDPLCFTAIGASSVTLDSVGSANNDINLYYSIDKTTWTKYEIGTSILLSTAGSKVYFSAGTPVNSAFSKDANNYYHFTFGSGDIAASGNVMSLLTPKCDTAVVIPNDSCFYKLFYGGSALTTAPELPATTLKANCYQSMFAGCSSLIAATTLPATKLEANCYQEMFSSCTNLNYIKCLATDISATNCTYNWVYGVGQSVEKEGTFVCASGMTSDWSEKAVYCGNPYSKTATNITAAVAWANDGLLVEASVPNAAKVRLTLAGHTTSVVLDLPTSTMANTGMYFVSVPDSILSHVGEDLVVDLYVSSSGAPMRVNSDMSTTEDIGTWKEVKVVQVPMRITSSAESSTLADLANATDTVWIGDGVTLTVNQNLTVNAPIYVAPNGKLVVQSNYTLECQRLVLRAGIANDTGKYEFKYPQLKVEGKLKTGKYNDNAATGKKDTIYYEYFLNNKQFYTISLPYDVKVKDITYLTGKAAYRSVGVQYYDEAERAANGTGWQYTWYPIGTSDPGTTTMVAGTGYTIFGAPQKETVGTSSVRRSYSYFRLPMAVDLYNSSESIEKKVIVTYHTPSGGASIESSGWNLVGNPYLSTYKGIVELDTCQTTQVLNAVIIPANDGQSYRQYSMLGSNKPELPAFKNFFVQVGVNDSLVFAKTNTALAPMRELESQETQKLVMSGVKVTCGDAMDDMGLMINNNYSAAYEINADLSKWMNAGLNLYASYGGNNLSIVATSESEASNSIPLIVKTSAAGTYTFAHATDWDYNADELEHLYLLDATASITTDLLTSNYEFTASASATIANRFYLSAIRKATPTDMESIRSGNGDLWVISGRGHLSVGGAVADGMVTIYSATGAMVYQGVAQANRPIALPQGMYVVKVAQDGTTYTNNGIVY